MNLLQHFTRWQTILPHRFLLKGKLILRPMGTMARIPHHRIFGTIMAKGAAVVGAEAKVEVVGLVGKALDPVRVVVARRRWGGKSMSKFI